MASNSIHESTGHFVKKMHGDEWLVAHEYALHDFFAVKLTTENGPPRKTQPFPTLEAAMNFGTVHAEIEGFTSVVVVDPAGQVVEVLK